MILIKRYTGGSSLLNPDYFFKMKTIKIYTLFTRRKRVSLWLTIIFSLNPWTKRCDGFYYQARLMHCCVVTTPSRIETSLCPCSTHARRMRSTTVTSWTEHDSNLVWQMSNSVIAATKLIDTCGIEAASLKNLLHLSRTITKTIQQIAGTAVSPANKAVTLWTLMKWELSMMILTIKHSRNC